jgi:hypothetical protein
VPPGIRTEKLLMKDRSFTALSFEAKYTSKLRTSLSNLRIVSQFLLPLRVLLFLPRFLILILSFNTVSLSSLSSYLCLSSSVFTSSLVFRVPSPAPNSETINRCGSSNEPHLSVPCRTKRATSGQAWPALKLRDTLYVAIRGEAEPGKQLMGLDKQLFPLMNATRNIIMNVITTGKVQWH